MHPRMFRASDLLFLWIPGLMITLIVAGFCYHYLVIHETVPWPGWMVSGLMVLGSLVVVGAFFWERWQWVRLYAYTVRGVDYFYMDGARKYMALDVERDLERMLGQWYAYYNDEDDAIEWKRQSIPSGTFIKGSVCVFRPEGHWEHTAPGWWTRKVTGISGWAWAMVGQGGKPVEETAHAHEMAHIHLNRWLDRTVPENAAHEIFHSASIS